MLSGRFGVSHSSLVGGGFNRSRAAGTVAGRIRRQNRPIDAGLKFVNNRGP